MRASSFLPHATQRPGRPSDRENRRRARTGHPHCQRVRLLAEEPLEDRSRPADLARPLHKLEAQINWSARTRFPDPHLPIQAEPPPRADWRRCHETASAPKPATWQEWRSTKLPRHDRWLAQACRLCPAIAKPGNHRFQEAVGFLQMHSFGRFDNRGTHDSRMAAGFLGVGRQKSLGY